MYYFRFKPFHCRPDACEHEIDVEDRNSVMGKGSRKKKVIFKAKFLHEKCCKYFTKILMKPITKIMLLNFSS